MSLELLILASISDWSLAASSSRRLSSFPHPSRRASISPFSFPGGPACAQAALHAPIHSEHPVPYRYEPFPLPFQGASAGWKFPSGYRGSAGGFLPYHRAFAGPLFTETIFGNACRFLKMVRRSSGRLFRISSILFWPMMESDPRPNPVSARRFTISFNRQFLPLMAYSLSPLRYTRRRILTSSKSTGRS